MARDILSEYGPESKKSQAPKAGCGGVEAFRDVQNYKEPVGPKDRHHEGPGLKGGTNHGVCGTQGKH